jgi:hypothetical protein
MVILLADSSQPTSCFQPDLLLVHQQVTQNERSKKASRAIIWLRDAKVAHAFLSGSGGHNRERILDIQLMAFCFYLLTAD